LLVEFAHVCRAVRLEFVLVVQTERLSDHAGQFVVPPRLTAPLTLVLRRRSQRVVPSPLSLGESAFCSAPDEPPWDVDDGPDWSPPSGLACCACCWPRSQDGTQLYWPPW